MTSPLRCLGLPGSQPTSLSRSVADTSSRPETLEEDPSPSTSKKKRHQVRGDNNAETKFSSALQVCQRKMRWPEKFEESYVLRGAAVVSLRATICEYHADWPRGTLEFPGVAGIIIEGKPPRRCGADALESR